MSPITHLLAGWLVANGNKDFSRRERTVITLAGICPDIDGFGIVAEALTRNGDTPLLWWSNYHHVLGHNLLFGLFVTLVAFLLTARNRAVAALVFVSFHLHLLGDVVGARGPGDDQWVIPYFLPFSPHEFSWAGQWELNAWPNFVITGLLLIAMFSLAWKRGYSPLEMISTKADAAFVHALRQRFGSPNFSVER
ncbi:MAG: metal-dependent hydrolase [Nitrospirae bacterium GWC2_57_13]|jgi:inner membrane protein|nr:MAG: metal-dependent hydrolase [Nitrospirae bacterium GWC2_57_13]OGW43434.1 MAG: metal-dependent hydrolase [Nitrospirae bacterium GWD2_57_8]